MFYDFENNPCYGLKVWWAFAAMSKYYDQYLEPFGITGRQYTFLYALRMNDGCSIKELADNVKIERSTMTRNIKTLIKSGLIVDKKAADERNSRLSLTPQGKIITEKAIEQWKKAQEGLNKHFGQAEMRLIDKALEDLCSLRE